MTEPKDTQENSEKLLKNCTIQVFSEEQETTNKSVDVGSGWSSLTVTAADQLQNQGLVAEKVCDPATSRGFVQQREQEAPNSVTIDVNALVAPVKNQISTSSAARLDNTDALGVAVKREVHVNCDGVESEHKAKNMKIAHFSVKHHRTNYDSLKQNHIFSKAVVQEAMKLLPKVDTSIKLQNKLQHIQRPMKEFPHAVSVSSTAALSAAHSPIVTLNPLNRNASTSKAPLPLSVPRVQLGDKPGHHRTGAPWVSIKTQLHSASLLPDPDLNVHARPRHVLRCGQCEKCFPNPSTLQAHLQTHTGERPFCCSLCGRSFTKLSNLKAHRRVHTGERPYSCLACGKCFTQKCNLKRHQRIHLDV